MKKHLLLLGHFFPVQLFPFSFIWRAWAAGAHSFPAQPLSFHLTGPLLPLPFSFSWCRLHVGPSGQVGLPYVTNSLAGCCVLGLGCWDWMCSGLHSRVFMRAMGATLISRTKVVKRRKEPRERKFCRACGAKRGRELLRGRSICAGI